MKIFGSWSELLSVVFKKNSQAITLRPNQTSTYTAARDIQLPEGDTAHVLVSRTSSDTLTNKTLTGNTAVNLVSGSGTLTLNTSGTVTLPNATDTLVGKATSDVLTNKDINGGTASDTLRITLPKNTATNLTGLTRKQGTIFYDTTNNVVKYDDGSNLNTVGTASAATATTAGLVTTFVPVVASSVKTVSSANYTVLDNDGYDIILVTTGASNRTITLPTAADNTGRTLHIKKVDNGAGTVIVDGEAAETVDGAATQTLFTQYGQVKVCCDGTSWYCIEGPIEAGQYTGALTGVTNIQGVTNGDKSQWSRVKNIVTVAGTLDCNISSTATLCVVGINLPIPSDFTASDHCNGTGVAQTVTTTLDPYVNADTANDRAQITWTPSSDPGNQTLSYNFSYIIL